MKRAIVYAAVREVEKILDGMNPNVCLFADVEDCHNKKMSDECQALAIVKLCDLESLEHKIKVIHGVLKKELE